MKISKFLAVASIGSVVASLYGGNALAAVSADEAKQLGQNLTLFGAEKAGNKDGSIPEYTGGLPTDTSPPGFKKGSGKYPSPFASEKPLFSITAQNMDKYADKLSEGQKLALKRYPSYRLDIYPSHRTVNFPKYILDATVRNATEVKAGNGGLTVENMAAGIPFPIPKTGGEVVWNNMMKWTGVAHSSWNQSFYVQPDGTRVLGSETQASFNYANNVPGMTAEEHKKRGGWYYQAAYNFINPPRTLGDGQLVQDNVDPVNKPRKAFAYSGSTRRVRLAPDIAYDTPIASAGGIMAYDDAALFLGAQDRFDFKLIGKKEMYLAYHNYDALFNIPVEKLLTAKYPNPDNMRWELHRVWVVEGVLKPGLRHMYSKRVLYIDEDLSGAGSTDEYDSAGKLYKGFFSMTAPAYDSGTSTQTNQLGFDFSSGNYCFLVYLGCPKCGFYPQDKLFAENMFTPDGLVKRSKQ